MAGGHENLNLKSKASEFMDQPSVQHDHVVVTIPPDTDASSITSSSAAVGFQTLNSPSAHEGVPTGVLADVSTSSTNTESQNPAPRRRRSQWNNLCFWTTFDLCSASIQLILLLLFLFVFRDEHPSVALQVWVIGYGVGCLATWPITILDSTSFEIGESQRFEKILMWLTKLLDGFFVLWFGVGLVIVSISWASRQAPHLSSLCTAFLVFTYFHYVLLWTICLVIQCCNIILRCIERPQRASATVISALPTYKFNAAQVSDLEMNQANKEDAAVRDLTGGDTRVRGPVAEVVECCICLDPFVDGVEVKELPCAHYFHVKCIDRWLKINGSCPICKSEVGT